MPDTLLSQPNMQLLICGYRVVLQREGVELSEHVQYWEALIVQKAMPFQVWAGDGK